MGRIFNHIIGRIYLRIKYKSWAEAENIKNEKYNGSYSTCGGIVILDLIAGTGAVVGIVAIITMIILYLYRVITSNI